jgi:hypothetical protein
VIGAAIGYEIGRRMDVTDRSCVGHALELTEPGQTVTWKSEHSRLVQAPPTEDAARADGCRKFRLIATGGFGLSEGRTVACPSSDGLDLAADARLGRR